MAIVETSDGRMVDMMTGQTVGQAPRPEGAPAPRMEQDIQGTTDIPVVGQVSNRALGLAQQSSWGFNSMLFALPDKATIMIGRALRMKDDEIFTLGKFFNQGETAPRNVEERYARAIGEGLGAGAPLTGITAWAARTMAPVKLATTTPSLIKNIAYDAVKFAQQRPGLAAALDVGINSAFETIRQTVDEQVDDTNPNKELYKALIPTAAIVGTPLALSVMPTYLAGKLAKNQYDKISGAVGPLEQEVMDSLHPVLRAPGINLAPRLLLKNARGKLATLFGDIENSPDAQQAIKALEDIMADPRFAQAGIELNEAEKTLYAPLVARSEEFMKGLSAMELEAFRERNNQNLTAFNKLLDNLAPDARQPIADALRAAQQERTTLFTDLLTAKKDLTEGEIALINERLGPANMDRVNDELRGALMGTMEFDANMRNNVLKRMGLRQAVSEQGLPMSTREEGKSLFPSRDIEATASELVNKYTPERPSARLSIPEPILRLREFMQRQQSARESMKTRMTKQLTDQSINDQIVGANLSPDLEEAVRSAAASLVRGGAKQGTKRRASLAESVKTDMEGNVNIPTGIPGKFIRINPKKIQQDADFIAAENTKVDMNLPEALDYLAAASRFRNDSIAKYNNAMSRGTSRITDAQRYLDTGEAVFKDVEKLILDNVPKIRTEYEGMKNVLSDYRAGFEQNMPLLISKQKADQFVLGNEQIMQTAFKSAENLRQLQTALGGSPRFDEMLTTGTMDWLRRNNIMKDGLVDGPRLKGLLDKNKNIVDALPPSIQQKLADEQTLADDYVRRMGELDQRKVAYQDAELDNLLAKSARPDADPREAVRAAIKDPALMRKLMDVMGKDPDQLAALRRSVYDFATEGAQKGGALAGLLENNKQSLSLLFKDTGHFADLQKLADMQRRVSLLQDVTGRLPAFEATDEAMQKTFGFGIRWLTTTYRDAAMGRVSPTTGVMAFLVRMTSALENKMYKRLFTKALEDREFAKTISNISSQEEGRQVAQKISEIGIIPRLTVFSAPRAMTQESAQQVAPERPAPNLPTVPRETQEGTARQMLRALPPAPPTRGFNFRMPTGAPGQQGQQRPAPPPGLPDISQQYQTMFPRDMLSDMLKSRVAPPQQ